MSYHHGERVVQARMAARAGREPNPPSFGTTIPDVARDFLRAQPLIVLGAADADGLLWSTMLTGRPGFLDAPDERTLRVAGLPGPDDPLAGALGRPAGVGTIVLEPGTRRRMRVNGRSTPIGRGLRIAVDQVVANCPKYIQRREPHPVAASPGVALEGTELTDSQSAAVARADTFFIATSDGYGHADASHRGGLPRFVQVLDAGHLRWPEYVGNGMFMTLGNLVVHSSAGLLFPDWDTGSLLHLSGTATVAEEPEEPHARAVVDFRVRRVVEVPGGSALRWSAPEFHRFNPPV